MRRLVSVALLAAACATAPAVPRARGAGGLFEDVPVYRAPAVGRCAKFKKGGSAAAACDEARYLGELYVRRLSSPDEVCLEGGFGDLAGAACLARASVADVAPGRVLLEVRAARPNSRWFDREAHQFWFEEGALVDLYLAEHGY
ncbi:MAG: hypothetical protein INH41_04460 [Myxococcaceae bacterium]|jgi:hypothetical protein|nr:hypothetical protein [Myxococcaceae bacterium]MCA3011636.1 hypothetical protein [Myxococcaceae bacterium]